MDDNCIAPKAGIELMMVLKNKKPLAILYKDKQPIQYEEALRGFEGLHVWKVRDNVLAASRDLSNLSAYRGLVSNRKSYTRKQFQRIMGELLGYTSEEITVFSNSEISQTCTCIECGGELE